MKNNLSLRSFTKRILFLGVLFTVAFFGSTATAQIVQSDFVDGGSYGTLLIRYVPPPNYDATKKYPVVVCLHGGGAAGTDNVSQLTDQPILWQAFTSTAARAQYPALVIVPQTYEWAWQPDDVVGVVKKLQAQFSIDTNRIYVTGLSRGGRGTWGCGQKYRNYFACIATCAGMQMYYDGTSTTRIDGTAPHPDEVSPPFTLAYIQSTIVPGWQNIPTWCSHTTDDPIIVPEWTLRTINAMRNIGGHPIYSMYTGGGHTAWNSFYAEPRLLNWMFAQNKAGGPVPLSPVNVRVVSSATSATITWNAPDTSTQKIMCYHVYKAGTRLTKGIDNLVGTDGSGFAKLQTTTTFTDATYKSGDTYTVTSVNYRQQESSSGTVDVVRRVTFGIDAASIRSCGNNRFILAAPRGAAFTVATIAGKIMIRGSVTTSSQSLDLSGLPAGLYSVTTLIPGKTVQEKILVK